MLDIVELFVLEEDILSHYHEQWHERRFHDFFDCGIDGGVMAALEVRQFERDEIRMSGHIFRGPQFSRGILREGVFPDIIDVQRRFDLDMDSVALTPETLSAVDAVLIAADHSSFDYEFIVEHAHLVVDTRNATHGIPDPQSKIHKA